jgi:hypothetical protein
MWVILSIVAVVGLICFWRGPNAVWGGTTMGLIGGFIAAGVYYFAGNSFNWSTVGKWIVISSVGGFALELIWRIKRRISTVAKKADSEPTRSAREPSWTIISVLILGLLVALIITWMIESSHDKKAVLSTSQASPTPSLTTTPSPSPELNQSESQSSPTPALTTTPSPDFIKLVKPVSIQTVSGAITLEAGLSVPFVSRDDNNVRFHYGNAEYEIPVDATELAK